MKKGNTFEISHHLDRAAYWQTRYLLHSTGGQPGRAKNARLMYNYHMKKAGEMMHRATELDLHP